MVIKFCEDSKNHTIKRVNFMVCKLCLNKAVIEKINMFSSFRVKEMLHQLMNYKEE